eukprot:3422301-Prymnesium_polylepis.2
MPSQNGESVTARQAALQASSVVTPGTGVPLGESTSSAPCPSHQQFLLSSVSHSAEERAGGEGSGGGPRGGGESTNRGERSTSGASGVGGGEVGGGGADGLGGGGGGDGIGGGGGDGGGSGGVNAALRATKLAGDVVGGPREGQRKTHSMLTGGDGDGSGSSWESEDLVGTAVAEVVAAMEAEETGAVLCGDVFLQCGGDSGHSGSLWDGRNAGLAPRDNNCDTEADEKGAHSTEADEQGVRRIEALLLRRGGHGAASLCAACETACKTAAALAPGPQPPA